MFKGLGGLGDMGKMMKAAQETQEKMARMQEDLALIEIIGESGAGLVKATATAKGELTGLEIDPSIFNASSSTIYFLYDFSASSLLTFIPTVESIFCIFSFFTFSSCISFNV